VTAAGIDVSVPEQRLHHRQIDPGLGRAVPNVCRRRVGVHHRSRRSHGGSERLCAVPPLSAAAHGAGLRNDEHVGAARFRTLGQQIDLNHQGDIAIQRHPTFPVALAYDLAATARRCRRGMLVASLVTVRSSDSRFQGVGGRVVVPARSCR
jgi:hypothetical protein